MKKFLTLFAVSAILLLLPRCVKHNVFVEPPDAPVIDSLAPAAGAIGTQIRIWGTGFSTFTSHDTLRINGIRLRVDSPSTSTRLLATLIDSTGTGPVVISVNGRSAEGPVFTYLGGAVTTGAPVITAVGFGWSDGSNYSVTMKELPASDSGIKVLVGGVNIAIDQVVRPGSGFYAGYPNALLLKDQDKIEANAEDIYADFQVTYNGVPSNSFPYQLQPQITDISSRSGDYAFAAGDTLVITGLYFGDRTKLNSTLKLVYNGVALTTPDIVSWSGTEIRALMPAYPTVPLDAGIPITVSVGNLDNRYSTSVKYLGTISGTATLVAGSDNTGSDDGYGSAASFNNIAGLAAGTNVLYVADAGNNRIRSIVNISGAGGEVSTLAGSTAGLQDGANADARFNYPTGVAVDQNGAVYVADEQNQRVRVIANGAVNTFAGANGNYFLNYPTGVATNNNNQVYIAELGNHRITEVLNATTFTFAGGVRGFQDGENTSAQFNQPYGIAIGSDGYLYVTDQQNFAVRKISPNATVTTLAGGTQGQADGTGTNAKFSTLGSIAVDANGTVYVADQGTMHLRKVSPAGEVTTFSPRAADGKAQLFIGVTGLAVDGQGILYVSTYTAIYKVSL